MGRDCENNYEWTAILKALIPKWFLRIFQHSEPVSFQGLWSRQKDCELSSPDQLGGHAREGVAGPELPPSLGRCHLHVLQGPTECSGAAAGKGKGGPDSPSRSCCHLCTVRGTLEHMEAAVGEDECELTLKLTLTLSLVQVNGTFQALAGMAQVSFGIPIPHSHPLAMCLDSLLLET